MYYQDGNMGKGMHQRRLLIAATLDAFYKANQEVMPSDADNNLGSTFLGKLDFTRIGLMGHSRGGDAVTSFIDYNRTRPAPGRRYDLRGVISLAPVDYERRAPYGMPYMTSLPLCDGDVSNIQGARFFERSQYIDLTDPFPRIQFAVQGTNHNYYNSVWSADSDDASAADVACGPAAANQDTSVRLSGGTTINGATPSPSTPTLLGTYTWATRNLGDPALMGEQEKVGLATMGSFFRRYVGGETGFDPYMTGEVVQDGVTPALPASACPTSANGARISCFDRMKTAYFAAPAEREDVIRPDADTPLAASAVGTSITGSGFANPYLENGGVTPKPATTASGIDWCNPEPDNFAPAQLGVAGLPTAKKACPLPAAAALGGQNGIRENGPVNQSYGMQLALAWDHPLDNSGRPATIGTRIPAADGDVSGLKALALGAGVNFFDPRNPDRGTDGLWNPQTAEQDFTIALTDKAGHEGTVAAGSPKYGTALQPTLGSTTARTHVILNEIRVPLTEFGAQGVDLTSVRKVELRFGGAGMPQSGSVQVADIRFQEAGGAPQVLADSPGASGPATGALTAGPDPAALIAATPRAAASPALPDVLGIGGATKLAAKCVDTKAPKAKVTSTSVKGRWLTLKGTATDLGCGTSRTRAVKAGSVASVQVTITRAAGGGKCRFVKGNGKLGRPMPCTTPIALVAKKTTAWSLKPSGRLAAGVYAITVRAIDASGNVQAAKATKLTVK